MFCIRNKNQLSSTIQHCFVDFLLPQKPFLCISDSIPVCLHSDVSIKCIGLHHSISVAGDLVYISQFRRMAQNLSKITSGTVPSCYQVNLAIDIQNITENNTNSHLFTCRHWVSQMSI